MTQTRQATLRRRGIRPAVRSAVIERDGMTCRRCGREVRRRRTDAEPYRPDHLHLDHVIPWAMGGSDDADNLIVSCAACNLARVRPARGSAAENRLLWERDGDDYFWRDSRYRPPRAVPWVDPDSLFTLPEAAEIMGVSVEDVIVAAVQGSAIYATSGTSRPIHVTFDPCLSSWVNRRMDELGWEE